MVDAGRCLLVKEKKYLSDEAFAYRVSSLAIVFVIVSLTVDIIIDHWDLEFSRS